MPSPCPARARRAAWPLALCAAAATAQPATPTPTTASFAVSATVAPGCWIAGQPRQNTGVGFGLLDFGRHPAVAVAGYSASLTLAGSAAALQCTPGTAATMTLDGGQNALGGQRRLRFGAYYLPYTLSAQPGGAMPILPGVATALDAGAGPTLLPVHGRTMVTGAGLPAGPYRDTVHVTVSW